MRNFNTISRGVFFSLSQGLHFTDRKNSYNFHDRALKKNSAAWLFHLERWTQPYRHDNKLSSATSRTALAQIILSPCT